MNTFLAVAAKTKIKNVLSVESKKSTHAVQEEPLEDFLKRVNKELREKLPGLKTRKLLHGKWRLLKKDNLPDLKTAAHTEGVAGVQKYCNEVTAFYNKKISESRIKKAI